MTKLLIALAAALPLAASAGSPASQYDDVSYPTYELADLPVMEAKTPPANPPAPQQQAASQGQPAPCSCC